MKNVIVAIFTEESKTYEALSKLKIKTGTTSILSAGIIKNENGSISVKDGYNLDDYSTHWAVGGLLGGLVGILGGPIGVLLGGSLGGIIGGGFDVGNADDTHSVFRSVVSKLENYDLALIVLADEEGENEINGFFAQYTTKLVIRESFVDVQAEVYQAEELAKELSKEAKKKMKEEKKEKWKLQAEGRLKEFQEKFSKKD